MVRWHHRLNRHDFEQSLGDSRGQRNLVCYIHGVTKIGHDVATEQQQIPINERDDIVTIFSQGINSEKHLT